MSVSDSPAGVRKPSLLRRIIKVIVCFAVLLVALFWYLAERRVERDLAERARFYHLRGNALKAGADVRPALLDEILAEYADSGDAVPRGDYWDLAYRRAELAADDREKAAYLDPLIAWAESARALSNRERLMAGQALLIRAEQSGDSTARIAFLDRAAALVAGIPDTDLYWVEARAILMKVNLTEDKAERIAMVDAYMAKAGSYDDPQLQAMACFLLRAKAEATDDQVAREQVLKELIDRFGESTVRVVRETVAWAMEEYAKSAESEEEEIARYFDLFFAFEEVDDRATRPIWRRADSRLDELTGSTAERLDLAIEHIRGRVPESRLVNAMTARADLAADRSGKKEEMQAIVAAYGESGDPDVRYEVLRMLSQDIRSIELWPEAIAACDYIIQRFSGSEDERVRSIVAQTFLDKTRYIIGKKEKISLIDQAIAMIIENPAETSQHGFVTAVSGKVALTGDRKVAIAEYQSAIARSANPFIIRDSLLELPRYTGDKAVRLAYYDQLISRFENSADRALASAVSYALQKRAELIDDITEKNRIYDRLIAAGAIRKNNRITSYGHIATEAMFGKARAMRDRKNRIAIYDAIIADGQLHREHAVFEARREKAELLNEVPALIEFYETIIASGSPREIRDAFDCKIRLITERDGRIAAHRDFIARFATDGSPVIRDRLVSSYETLHRYLLAGRSEKLEVIEALIRMEGLAESALVEALRSKAELIDEPALKVALYDRILKYEEGGTYPWSRYDYLKTEFARASWLDDADERRDIYSRVITEYKGEQSEVAHEYLPRAYLGLASLAGEPEEAEEFFQKALVLSSSIEMYFPDSLPQDSLVNLKRLSEITGRNCLDEYLDTIIRSENDAAASAAYLVKAVNTPDIAARLRIYDELIKRYDGFENIWVIQNLLSALEQKLGLTDDAHSRQAVCDQIITVNTQRAFSVSRYVKAKALFEKAGYVKDVSEKKALYDEVIEIMRSLPEQGFTLDEHDVYGESVKARAILE